jgi:hypothetical protein
MSRGGEDRRYVEDLLTASSIDDNIKEYIISLSENDDERIYLKNKLKFFKDNMSPNRMNPDDSDTNDNLSKQAKKKIKQLTLAQVRKLPYKTLNRMIKKAKEYLKKNEIMQKICAEYDMDISVIDYIPTMFGNLDVSAKTDKGIVILNYKLLTDGDFFKDYSYLIHEYQHFFDQAFSSKATKSSDEGSYLDNKHEQKAFKVQVEYIADEFGKDEAIDYVDNLLEHHEVDDKKEYKDKKELLLSKI